MSILAAYCVPHPPIILPAVGGGEAEKIHRTADAFERVARDIARLRPETIILTSPHLVSYQDYFHIAPGSGAHGSMARFGAPDLTMAVRYDEELIRELSLRLARESFPAGTEGERDRELDHASFVPLWFIQQAFQDFKLVRVGLSELDLASHYELGMRLKEVAADLGRSCVLVASGDLSLRLKTDGPYGFHPDGPVYDRRIMTALGEGQFLDILRMDPLLCENAGECGHRSFAIMAGALDRTAVKTETLSYEGPFGVGYGVVAIVPTGVDESRNFLDQYREDLRREASSRKRKSHPLVNLAFSVIKARLDHESFHLRDFVDKEPLPEEFLRERAGVFVSLKKAGQLRGCIGTIAPTTASIAQEVQRNAIEAAFHDPRFMALRAEEFSELVCSVDVLSPAESIASPAELDPVNYGVIVTSGHRRGLLLPNLEGVDTVERQIAIAKAKAGIGETEPCELERFKVVRYE